MSLYTTKELRDILTPIHSRIDDFINEAIKRGIPNVSVSTVLGLVKCDYELGKLEIDMCARDMIEKKQITNNK